MTRLRRATGPAAAGDALNALDLALEEIILSSVSAANGTASTASLSNSAVPSASASPSESASSSAVVSEVDSASASASALASEIDAVGSESVVSGSATASFTPSASSAPAALVPSTSALSAEPRSASDQALSVPKNAAAAPSATSDSAASLAPSEPASSSSTEKSIQTNATTSSKDDAPTSAPAPPPPPETTISASSTTFAPSPAPETTPSTEVPPSSTSQAPSSSSDAVSTQRMQTSSAVAAASSNKVDQAPSPSSSNAAAPRPTSAASSPQATGASNQVQNSPPDAGQRGSQPSASDLPSSQDSSNLGNSLIGISPSLSVHVDSTLSMPQAVTFSSGDSTFVTTPAIFASFSVSSGKDGHPLATFTSVFANPTNVPQTATLSDSSFWDKKGAIAGVFTAIGLIILASILGTFYFCRRKRRGDSGRPFAKTAQFRRFSGPPEMSQQPTTYQAIHPRRYAMDEPQRYLLAPSITSGPSNGLDRSASRGSSDAHQHHPGALGLTGLLGSSAGRMQEYYGPFSDYHRYISTGDTRLSTPPGETNAVGIAVTTDLTPRKQESSKLARPEAEAAGPAATAVVPERRRAPSPAPSTPSIYPPSLPPVPEKDEDDYLFYERETKRRPESQPQLPTPPPRAIVNDAPDPRNPFASPLDPIYDVAPKLSAAVPPPIVLTNQSYRPLTPSDSSASHSPSTPQFSEAGGEIPTTKPLSVATSPYSNGFLGRSVSMRTEPLPRPRRNPLRLSASGASLQQDTDLP